MTSTVLIAGASGLVGSACVERYVRDGWDVVAFSRRRPEIDTAGDFRHRAVDLRDESAVRDAVADLEAVTHVVYAAVYEKPGLVQGWVDPDQMAINLAMLRNLIEPLADVTDLRHVTLLQGTKAYGSHLHPIRIPARERYPRDEHENFYWLHEDYVRTKAQTHGFDFTIMRPQLVVGPNYGVVMNLPPVIGVYAAICKHEGRPFAFPGGEPYVWEAVDASLVANAIRWAGQSPAAAGEHFNLTNGEVFEWRDMWPALADTLGVETGPDEPLALAQFLPSKAAVWDDIVARHGLRRLRIEEILGESHHYADLCFAHGSTRRRTPTFVSTVKIKQAGFTETMDTELSFVKALRTLQRRRVIPAAE